MHDPKYSIYHAFHESALRYADRIALTVLRDDSEMSVTYGELLQRVDACADRFSADGMQSGDAIILMLKNSPEWVVTDLAAAKIGVITVPIHTTYTQKYIDHIIQNSGAVYACVDGVIFDSHPDSFLIPTMRKVYHVGIGTSADITDARVTEFVYEKVEHGSGSLQTPTPDQVHSIVYTSGTTGLPKGVELTHRNILSNVYALLEHITVYPTDSFFSFLPLSHILERTAGYYVPLVAGASICYARSIETLAEDMQRARPTIVISVPRIFERVHEKIIKKLSANPVIHMLFVKAHRVAVQRLSRKLSLIKQVLYHIGETLIFHKVRSAFGGRLRFAVSGGASLPKHIAEFFESMGVLVLEGYGLTETSPVLTANKVAAHRFGTVGLPLSSVTLRIDGNGEILARGEGVMRGYHAAPDITAEVIDSEGWLHTGDLGKIDDEGFLTIIGRIKEMIVLSTGRNIFPVPIEQELEESPLILQAMVYGDNERAISAFIVPEFKNLSVWCEKEGIEYQLPQVLSDERVKKLYEGEIQKMLQHFPHYEQVRNFKLVPEKWTVENDMLTLSQKLKRGRIIGLLAQRWTT